MSFGKKGIFEKPSFSIREEFGCFKSITQVKNFLLKKNNFEFLENTESDTSRDLWVKIMKNMGRCHFKLQEFGKSIEKFNEILSSEPKNLSVLDLKVKKIRVF